MTAQEMVNLIEEMVEIKVRHHAAMAARASGHANRDIARAISQMNVADRDRLQYIKTTLVRTFEGSETPA